MPPLHLACGYRICLQCIAILGGMADLRRVDGRLAGMASRGRRRMADCFPSLDPLGSQDLHVTSNIWTTRLARNLPNAARSIWRRLVQEATLGPGGKRGQDRALNMSWR